jgi:hypothetical protein
MLFSIIRSFLKPGCPIGIYLEPISCFVKTLKQTLSKHATRNAAYCSGINGKWNYHKDGKMIGGQNNYEWVGVSRHRLGGAGARENTAPRAVLAGGDATGGCHCLACPAVSGAHLN